MKNNLLKKFKWGLYGLTSESHSLGRSNKEVVDSMLGSGIKIIQYREKDKPMRLKYEDCLYIRKATSLNDALFIVNDHLDLAMAAGADGVHLGQDDMPLKAARNLLGDEMIIGVSTHSPEQAEAAVAAGADYIGVGPIFKTYTKPDVCDPVGLSYLRWVSSNIEIPFTAIGGIKKDNVGEVIENGADCTAMVTEIVGAPDIGLRVGDILKRMEDARRLR